MSIEIIRKENQASGQFNGGEIIENKPVGFPQEGGALRSYSNVFYWANAIAIKDSTIGLHPHQGFEILSFVLAGRIRHFDTKLKTWKWLSAGDVQVIQAGSGISHAEHMTAGARMFQIWFDPNLEQTLRQEAQYTDYRSSTFRQTSGDHWQRIQYIGSNSELTLDTEGLNVFRLSTQNGGVEIDVPNSDVLALYVLHGPLEIGGAHADVDDLALIREEGPIIIKGKGEVFGIQSPKQPTYVTYAERMRMV